MVLAAAAAAAALLLATLAGHAEIVAYLAPLVALGIPLVAGRYLGEGALERLRTRREPSRRRLAGVLVAGARRAAGSFPRGGRLIAEALAERGPPGPALT